MSNDKSFHSRSLHNGPYDFDALVAKNPSLANYIKSSPAGKKSINFADAKAVMALNQSLLLHHYSIENWSVPKGHLCPPIPSRADYLHHVADILSEENQSQIPVGTKIKGLDIGTGTNCIYPLLGNSIYGWKFVASDIDSNALNHAKTILNGNPKMQKNIKTRFQKSAQNIFKNLIKADEKFDFTMCNPPFYSSAEEAAEQSEQKMKNLNANKIKKGQSQNLIKNHQSSNFGGKNAELWCPGGESEFIKVMIKESQEFQKQVKWFTTLVSQKTHLIELQSLLQKLDIKDVRIIEMQHGKKISHLLGWKYNNTTP